jgi:hypothetical protein
MGKIVVVMIESSGGGGGVTVEVMKIVGVAVWLGSAGAAACRMGSYLAGG